MATVALPQQWDRGSDALRTVQAHPRRGGGLASCRGVGCCSFGSDSGMREVNEVARSNPAVPTG